MIELGSIKPRSKTSRKFLWFLVPGLIILVSTYEVGALVEPLPRWLGGLIFASTFVLGLSLSLLSPLLPNLIRWAKTEVSTTYVSQLEHWRESGQLVIVIDGLSDTSAWELFDTSRRLFGTYIQRTFERPNGKIWTVKALRVGAKILPTGSQEGRPLFSAILYRRDLAGLKGMRRPWRKVPNRDGSIEFMKPGRPVELPSWMA